MVVRMATVRIHMQFLCHTLNKAADTQKGLSRQYPISLAKFGVGIPKGIVI